MTPKAGAFGLNPLGSKAMKKKILYLHVKGEYFEAIKSGEKSEEYRLLNRFWCVRLDTRTFDEIHILKGYPKKSDLTRRLIFPWNGYKLKRIVHKEFGKKPVDVYAIRLSDQPMEPTSEILRDKG